MDPLRKSPKYPGRNRVMSRDDARDVLWQQRLALPQKFPCTQPYIISAIGLPSMLDAKSGPMPVEMQGRCRKCAGCMRHRRTLWVARAVDEISVSSRTWFGTLTVAPEWRYRIECLAEMRLREGNEQIRSLAPAEQFQYLADFLGKEATRWLKRLRKKAKLRYLLVFEAHKDGFPHIHLLLHEGSEALRKADLEAQWRYGFSNWRLVDQRDTRPAWYVSKYLTKSSLTRVRASQLYGQRHKVAVTTERLTKAVTAASEAKRAKARLSSEEAKATRREPIAG